MYTLSQAKQAALDPETALEILRQGNRRFRKNVRANRNTLELVRETAGGQFPFAIVLGCVDSRVPTELVLDQAIGDIFSVRVAGNVLSEDVLGSIEFACKLAGAKLVVVLGHSSCGAVKGACAGAKMGHLTGLLAKIRPSVEQIVQSERIATGDAFHQAVAEPNVEAVVQQIQARSPVIKDLIDEGQVGIVGSMYSVETGAVRFGDLVFRGKSQTS